MLVAFNRYNSAAAHADDPVRTLRNVSIVCDEYRCCVLLFADVMEKRKNLDARLRVERAGRLFPEENSGPFGNGSCDGTTLLFAAGKLRRKLICVL